MRWLRSALLLGVSALLLASCSTFSLKTKERKDPTYSFVYGKMDLTKLDDKLDSIAFRQAPYDSKDKLLQFKILSSGVFYAENVPPDDYVFWFVSGETKSGFLVGQHYTNYFLSPKNSANWTERDMYHLKRGGLVYLGSWKGLPAKDEKNRDAFTIDEDKTVSEADVLKEILPNTEGTEWNAMIREALGMPPAPPAEEE